MDQLHKNLGKADITSLVDFNLLNEYFSKNKLKVKKIVSQKFFLEKFLICSHREFLWHRTEFNPPRRPNCGSTGAFPRNRGTNASNATTHAYRCPTRGPENQTVISGSEALTLQDENLDAKRKVGTCSRMEIATARGKVFHVDCAGKSVCPRLENNIPPLPIKGLCRQAYYRNTRRMCDCS